jgi:hypothetical protein
MIEWEFPKYLISRLKLCIVFACEFHLTGDIRPEYLIAGL